MPTKRHKPEQIVAKLRQVDVLTSQGTSVADAIRSIGVTEVILIESWRRHSNTVRPHASLGYRPPPPQRSSSQVSNPGRPRASNPLRRPGSRWPHNQDRTDIHTRPLIGGRSMP